MDQKVTSRRPVSSKNFAQYIKFKGASLEMKKLCDEELENSFSSLKSNKTLGYDGISSNMIKTVSEEIFGFLKEVLNLSTNPDVFPENVKITCATPNFKSGN